MNSNDEVANEILAASTLYDVLGVPKDIESSSSKLRRAYLSKSVLVHPDKNGSPQATQAFQRVAEAWTTLSDDTARREYDRSIRSRGCSRQRQQQDTYYARPPPDSAAPSFQEAMFVFAAVASSLSGSRAAGDFAQTLYWAQKLAEGYQQQQEQDKNQQQQRSTNNVTNNNNTSNDVDTATTAALAIGSGLRVVAGTSRLLGFRKSAKAMENAAMAAEVAAVSAVVADKAKDIPMVARAFEKGKQSARNLSGNPQFQNAAREAAQNPQVQSTFLQGLKFAAGLASSLAENDAATPTNRQEHPRQQQRPPPQNPNYYAY